MSDIPMTKPACEHHYESRHQPDFPNWIYWIRVCQFCGHMIPELSSEILDAVAHLNAVTR